jgi:hypothetical protein
MATAHQLRAIIIERARTDVQRCVVAVARRYDLSATELLSILLAQAQEANQIAWDHELHMALQEEPK